MNHRWFSLAGACLLFACSATSPVQAESIWKRPTINPFARRSTTKAAPPKKSSGFKMPNLIPSWAKQERKKSPQPSTWSKISGQTKEFFGKTKDVLTPWDNPPKKTNNSSLSQRFHMGSSNEKTEKKSFFTSWLPEKEEVDKPRSMNESLKQPKPSP